MKPTNGRWPVNAKSHLPHYVVPGTVNGMDVEVLLDTGATDVAIPPPSHSGQISG